MATDIIDVLARARAFATRVAQPIASHQQLVVQHHALVLAPLMMAGEHQALHAVAWGRLDGPPSFLSVADPRIPEQREELFRALGNVIQRYAEWCRGNGIFPQIVVSSPPAAGALDALADRQRYHRTDARVQAFGTYLSYFTERLPVAGQQALVVATDVLCRHWATGLAPSEEQHLAADLAWLSTHPGVDPFTAAEIAEEIAMGSHTDPAFDIDVLEPLVSRYQKARKAGDMTDMSRLEASIGEALIGVVLPIFAAIQRAVQVLRRAALPPMPGLDELADAENQAFQSWMASRDGGYRLTLQDSPVAAVYRFEERESAEENASAAVLIGDRVGLARGILAGEVVLGRVVHPRSEGGGNPILRFAVRTAQRQLRLRIGDELLPLPQSIARVEVEMIERDDLGSLIHVRMTFGQQAIGLPVAGAEITLSSNAPDWGRIQRDRGQIKKRLARPAWTHDESAPLPPPTPRPGPIDPLAAIEVREARP